MSDNIDRTAPTILGHAYWLPGVEGIALEALLADLINGDANARLTITKQRTPRGTWSYSFDMQKGSDKVPDL